MLHKEKGLKLIWKTWIRFKRHPFPETKKKQQRKKALLHRHGQTFIMGIIRQIKNNFKKN